MRSFVFGLVFASFNCVLSIDFPYQAIVDSQDSTPQVLPDLALDMIALKIFESYMTANKGTPEEAAAISSLQKLSASNSRLLTATHVYLQMIKGFEMNSIHTDATLKNTLKKKGSSSELTITPSTTEDELNNALIRKQIIDPEDFLGAWLTTSKNKYRYKLSYIFCIEMAFESANGDKIVKVSYDNLVPKYELADTTHDKFRLKVDPSTIGHFPIVFASGKGWNQIVHILLQDERIDPGADNDLALREAVNYGHEEVVNTLYGHPKVNPAANQNEAIRVASRKGYDKIVAVLLSDGRVNPLVPDAIILSPLRSAIKLAHFKTVQNLLANHQVKQSLSLMDPKPLLEAVRISPELLARQNLKRTKRDISTNKKLIIRALLSNSNVDASFNDNEAFKEAQKNKDFLSMSTFAFHPRVKKQEVIELCTRDVVNGCKRILDNLKQNLNSMKTSYKTI